MVGDFNGDGFDDIAGRGNGQWWIAESNPEIERFSNNYWGFWTTNTVWSDVKALDFNDDGRDDILGRAANGEWWLFESDGDFFRGSLVARWSPGSTWHQITVGNFAL